MLHKDLDRKGSIAKTKKKKRPQGFNCKKKKPLTVNLKEAWRQDELIGGKPTVVK
jgi:hypothetical protein